MLSSHVMLEITLEIYKLCNLNTSNWSICWQCPRMEMEAGVAWSAFVRVQKADDSSNVEFSSGITSCVGCVYSSSPYFLLHVWRALVSTSSSILHHLYSWRSTQSKALWPSLFCSWGILLHSPRFDTWGSPWHSLALRGVCLSYCGQKRPLEPLHHMINRSLFSYGFESCLCICFYIDWNISEDPQFRGGLEHTSRNMSFWRCVRKWRSLKFIATEIIEVIAAILTTWFDNIS